MGARKKISAEKRKEALKTMYFAKLQNVPTSPRKMRLVADMIRGMEVNRALGVLKFSSKEAAARVEKLLRSAIANWEQFSAFSFTFVFLLPVSNCRAQQLFHSCGSLF